MHTVTPSPPPHHVSQRAITLAYLPWTREEDSKVVHRAVGHINPVFVGESDTAYAELFALLWSCRDRFILVEHDVIPWPGALKELRGCPEPWCSFAYGDYDLKEETWVPLGVAKFNPVLLGELPFDSPPVWNRLDGTITETLRGRGYEVHQHYPGVTHLDRVDGINGDYRR